MPTNYSYTCVEENALIEEIRANESAPPTVCVNEGATIDGLVVLSIETRNNLGATVNPTVSDDFTAGYDVASHWINTVTRHTFECAEPSVDGAVWKQVNTYTNFDGVVSPNASGSDYSSIAAAFQDGRMSVFVKNGVYYETQDIVVPDRGQMLGETPGLVIVVLIGLASVRVDGSDGVRETAGTVSIAKNSAVVTGTGTSFTNLSAAHFISLGNNYFEIASIESDTSLTLTKTFVGNSIVANSYVAQAMLTGIYVSNFVFMHSASTGLLIQNTRHSGFENITVSECETNIQVNYSGDMGFRNVISVESNGPGFVLDNTVDILCDTLNIFNGNDVGIRVSNSYSLVLNGCSSTCNSTDGFCLINSRNINLTDCISLFNGCGINGETSCSHLMIAGTSVENNNGGINLRSVNSTIRGCIVGNNGQTGVDLGMGDSLVACQIHGHTVGVVCNQDNCTMNSNRVNDNDCGALVRSNNCVISSNHFQTGSTAIWITGVDSVVTSNRITDYHTGLELSTASDGILASLNHCRGCTTAVTGYTATNSLVNNLLS